MDQTKIDRINELAKLAKQRPLNEAETQERAVLRAEYIAAFRTNMRSTLENTYVQYPDGTKKPLSEVNK